MRTDETMPADPTSGAPGDLEPEVLARALDTVSESSIITDGEQRILYANAAFCTVTGYSRDEVLGLNCRFLQGPDTDPASVAAISTALSSGAGFQGDILNYRRNGEPFWNALTVTPMLTEGRLSHFISVQRDVTERVLARDRERREAARRYREQRLESLGRLAAGIAHDVNNALVPVTMGADLLLMSEQDPRRIDLLDQIKAGATRSGDLIRRVLQFARGSEGQRTPVAVAEVMEELGRFCQSVLPAEVDVRFDVGQVQDSRVLADSTQLLQVLVNLVTNASDAMPGGGTVTISAVEEPAEKPSAGAGRSVVTAVADQGAGIPDALLERIWDPFFTTKPFGAGTGLGLPVSESIVRAHQGELDVENLDGGGARFRVRLPLLEGDGAAAPTKECAPDPMRLAGRTVLIVEDDPDVSTVARQALMEARATVLSAVNGQEAIRLLTAHEDEIDVIICDLTMPRADGRAVHRFVSQLPRAVPVVMTSGLDNTGEFRRFLPKPYTRAQLAAAVADALADPAA